MRVPKLGTAAFSQRSLFCLLAVHLGVVHSLAGQSGPTSHRKVAGCYELVAGEWQPSLIPGDPSHTLPRVVSLDTASVSVGYWKLSPDIAYPSPRLVFPGFPRWDLKGDTVTMVWSNGFTPTIVRLRLMDGYLEGSAEAQSDVVPPGKPNWPRAPVTAQRVKCTTNGSS